MKCEQEFCRKTWRGIRRRRWGNNRPIEASVTKMGCNGFIRI